MLISLLTGLSAGAIHVMSGADHIVAMAPGAISSPKYALRRGMAWGLGHSMGVVVFSIFAILLKDFVKIKQISSLAEFSVGIALLYIGIMAIRTSIGLDIHTHRHKHQEGNMHEHFHLHIRGRTHHSRHTHALTGLGVLHGFAGGTHLIAVIPALALPPIGAVVYMGAYLLGSVLTMGIFLGVISMASSIVGKKFVPALFGFAGGLSVVTGLFWIHKTFPQIL